MPVSQSLKLFKQILKVQLNDDGEDIKKIKIKEKSSLISISIECNNKTAKFNMKKIDVAEILNNTKENYSLNYLVKGIPWRGLPL